MKMAETVKNMKERVKKVKVFEKVKRKISVVKLFNRNKKNDNDLQVDISQNAEIQQNSNNTRSMSNITENEMDDKQITKSGDVKQDVAAEENPGKSMIESEGNIDNVLETVNKQIQQASNNTKLACSTLRSLYTINASSVEGFIDFRRRITNCAKIYSDEVFPLASKIISHVQDFMENYSTLKFDDFKEGISDLAEDARQNQNLALSVKNLHVEIGDDLKNEEDRVINLLENEAQVYKEKADGLQKTSLDSIANEEESKLAISAALQIKNSPSIPIKNSVDSLTSIAEFFAFFGEELTSIANSSDDRQQDHYSRCRDKANSIINSCRSYIVAIPDCRTDLAVIPDDYDKNYVKEWLSTKGARHLSSFNSEKN